MWQETERSSWSNEVDFTYLVTLEQRSSSWEEGTGRLGALPVSR